MPRPGASPSRPAPATAIAMPGRSASTASAPSASGSAGPTARRCRAWWGARAAAPILFDAFARSGKTTAPLPHAPRGALFAANAKLPLPLQRFRPVGLPSEGSEPAVKIMFPPNGARLELTAERRRRRRSAGVEDFRRRAAAHRARERRSAGERHRQANRCSISRTGRASSGSPSWTPRAPPTASWCGCSRRAIARAGERRLWSARRRTNAFLAGRNFLCSACS